MKSSFSAAHSAALGCAILAFILIAGCTSYGPAPGSPTATATPAPGGTAVTIQNFAFSPATLLISSGSTVSWTNRDAADHKIVNDATGQNGEGALFQSPALPQGGTYSFTFSTPGVYPYHCSIHPSMKATITVV
jgi:plastocyanin